MHRIPRLVLSSGHAAVLRGTAALTALLASPLAAQLTVGPAGSGALFTEISAAVSAAQPGEFVLVAPGTYGAFLVDKAIRVVGAGHQHVIVDQGAGVAGLRVVGLAANEAAQVSGLSVQAAWGVSTAFPQVEVAQNAGRVVLSDVYAGTLLQPGAAGVATGPTGVITSSEAVLLDGCRLDGLNPAYIPQVSGGAESALHVTDSSVWISDTALQGAYGGYAMSTQNGPFCFPSNSYGPGAPALVATDSSIVLARCRVGGGLGGALIDCIDPLNWSMGFNGGAGARLIGSDLQLGGGPGNQMFGGGVTWQLPFAGGTPPSGGPGVLVDGTSTVRAAADAQVGGGSGSAPAFEVLAGGTLVQENYPLPTAGFRPTLAAPGESVTLSVSGAAPSVQLLWWSRTIGLPTAIPGLTESLALPRGMLGLLGVVATDDDGLGFYVIAVPPRPSVAGLTLVVQTVEVGPNGLLLSNPTTLAIRSP